MRSFGLRTVDKVGNATGILGYSVGFVVDSKGGRGLSGPPEYITVPATQDRLVVSIPQTSIKDGDVIVFWFSVSDMVGNKDDVRLTVGLDRTAPKITADEFKKKTVDDFTSRYLYRLFKRANNERTLSKNRIIICFIRKSLANRQTNKHPHKFSTLYLRHESRDRGVTMCVIYNNAVSESIKAVVIILI